MTPSSPSPLDDATRARLLVVDDQPANVQALYQALSADHQVLVATGGVQALALARAKHPDLILLDVVMPDLDGHEVCRRLKADPATRDIPLIFVSARSEEADETIGLDLGAADYISKPINPAIVRARVRTQLTVKRQADQLREMAFFDSLTGVLNRRSFDQRLRHEWLRALRTGVPLALVLLDIDAFKAYNDRLGHSAGDQALRRVAQALSSVLSRPADLLARYGGEEFVCLLPETYADGAQRVARRLEQAVQALAIAHPDSPVGTQLTVSQGVAAVVPKTGDEPTLLLDAADQQLYRAKQSGRARICVAE